ncbi:hypothetical protein BN1708_000319, partial [Verticillium longisporum]
MSDDEADHELLYFLRQHFQRKLTVNPDPETGILADAEAVYDDSIDVAIDMRATKAAAETIHAQMQHKSYSPATWSQHELHPKAKDESTLAFIFTMDLLNFSFWSELPEDERFAIEYRGRKWTGYWSLVAALQRALEEGIPITTSDYWQNEDECTLDALRHVFRSATDEEMPLLSERLVCLREAGQVLYENYDCSHLLPGAQVFYMHPLGNALRLNVPPVLVDLRIGRLLGADLGLGLLWHLDLGFRLLHLRFDLNFDGLMNLLFLVVVRNNAVALGDSSLLQFLPRYRLGNLVGKADGRLAFVGPRAGAGAAG